MLIDEFKTAEQVCETDLQTLVSKGLPKEVYLVAHSIIMKKFDMSPGNFKSSDYKDTLLSDIMVDAPYSNLNEFIDILHDDTVSENVAKYFKSFINYISKRMEE